MKDITRRDALALGVSAAALAATGASAQTASTIKAADVPAPTLAIEKGANLKLLRPVRFVKADEDVFRANAAKFTEKMGVEVKVDFVGWEDINQQTAVTSNSGAGHHRRFLRRAAYLRRQADRTHRRRRLSRQTLWRLAAAGAEIR
jgi:multiple sugar transport system substrate-binding protein